MSLQLDTIVLFCADVNRLSDFYISFFGFAVVEEIPGEWIVLDTGKAKIGLHQIGEAYRSETPFRAESNTKLVFDVEEDLFPLRERWLEKGVQMGEIKTFDNYPFWICDGEDPEGNVFQLRKSK